MNTQSGSERRLGHVRLRPDHQRTGNTKHIVDGAVVEAPYELRIMALDGDSGVYLIHFAQSGSELTDTYHDSREAALQQAEFEFGVKESDWTMDEGNSVE
jgi:hypothetical protein